MDQSKREEPEKSLCTRIAACFTQHRSEAARPAAVCGRPRIGLFAQGGILRDGAWQVYRLDQPITDAVFEAGGFPLGHQHLRSIAGTDDFQLDLAALHAAVQRDREDDLQPFCVVANAGTTNTGAIDPLAAIADFCEREGLWFHVDGSYGAFGRLDPRIASRYRGMERADSLTLDPHKWLSVPYECGCALVRNREQLVATFAVPPPDYLRETLGDVRFTDYSMQLSRGFHALKLWIAFMSAGRSGLVALVSLHNALARHLAELIDDTPELERMAPVELSTVCFRAVPPRLRSDDAALDAFNKAVMREVQLEGEAFLSGATLRGFFVLRACVLHPMTTEEDIVALVGAVQRAVGRLRGVSTCIRRTDTRQSAIESDIRR